MSSSRPVRTSGGPVRAVLLDLDDTLYPQAAWLAGALDGVAAEASRRGLDGAVLRRALDDAVAAGSDRGDTIDRALAAAGMVADPAPLVAAFRSHLPSSLPTYPGTAAALERLAAAVPLGLVTDGDVPGQRGKLAATGLERWFQVVVYSDELGRRWRKPDPRPMREALELLGVPPAEAVVIGDRPDKDVAAAHALGSRAVRVRTGEYRDRPDLEGTWRSVASLAEAVREIEPYLATPVGEPR
jgi:putative hydrolase of the HAD superfamily